MVYKTICVWSVFLSFFEKKKIKIDTKLKYFKARVGTHRILILKKKNVYVSPYTKTIVTTTKILGRQNEIGRGLVGSHLCLLVCD